MKAPSEKPPPPTWTEAIATVKAMFAELDAEIEQGREAEAQYWREFFNEDRVEELEDCLRWLLHLAHGVSKGGDKPSSEEWDAAWKEAHRLLDGTI
jgi:hypothetical protein